MLLLPLLATVLLLGLPGCSLPVSLPGSAGSTPGSPATPSGTGGGTGSGPPAADATGGPTSPAANAPPTGSAGGSGPPDVGALGPIVGSRTSAYQGGDVTIDLYRIVRTGNLAYVTLTARSPDEVIAGGMLSAPGSASYTANGITLVDAAHKRLYLSATHGTGDAGECICSDLGQVTLGPQPTVITAAFAAPPAGVTELGVQVPHFGVFPRVPVV